MDNSEGDSRRLDNLDVSEDKSFMALKQKRESSAGKVGGQKAQDAVTLESCLEGYSKDETLSEDDPWFCPKCKEMRPAVVSCAPWRLPDVLVIHLKRFLASARWREKISTQVVFPLTGLNMAPFVPKEARAGLRESQMVYDLFAVSNHLGSMAGDVVVSLVCRLDFLGLPLRPTTCHSSLGVPVLGFFGRSKFGCCASTLTLCGAIGRFGASYLHG